jgi:hypothetical protein
MLVTRNGSFESRTVFFEPALLEFRAIGPREIYSMGVLSPSSVLAVSLLFSFYKYRHFAISIHLVVEN